ncbi:hypothetical protein [Nocardioides sp. SYSU DS0663]|uniref:hypothetical protein n=1 Tax=Nocardioides sp. SYSU DS0663 TaxID=3416445 RepID=UPI003F4BA863
MLHPLAIDPSLAGIITAIVGGIVGVGGLFLNIVGKRDQARQQAAADAAAEDKRELDQTAQALNAVRLRAEMAEAGERDLREENLRLRRENNDLDDAIDRQRDAHRREVVQQAARCRTQLDSLTDSFIALQRVVHSEIAQIAARTALDRMLPHPHELPPGSDDRDEPQP